ncbi:MAG: hypothetical protein V1835_00130 [Candidatus Micrarchaeota archaeon]
MGKRKGSTEWTPIYMLIVMIIAAILIYSLIKPMAQRSADIASGNLEEAKNLITTAIILLQ